MNDRFCMLCNINYYKMFFVFDISFLGRSTDGTAGMCCLFSTSRLPWLYVLSGKCPLRSFCTYDERRRFMSIRRRTRGQSIRVSLRVTAWLSPSSPYRNGAQSGQPECAVFLAHSDCPGCASRWGRARISAGTVIDPLCS